MDRQSYSDRDRNRSERNDDSDRESGSRPLYDWESQRNDSSGYSYGGYAESGYGGRDQRRYADYDKSRERNQRYNAGAGRDGRDEWHRGYGPRRYGGSDYGSRDAGEYGYRARQRERDDEDRRSAWEWASYADPYGSPTYIPYASADFGRSTYDRSVDYARRNRNDRGFFERAGDEVLSWFGDEDAAARREADHRGRGPADYTRSDDRIREDVNDKLTEDSWVDASAISVTVAGGEVTLDGTIDSKTAKRRAEDLTDRVSGVKHVQNNLRVSQTGYAPEGS